MIKCLKCQVELPPTNEGGRVASISGGIMGDEYTETYYLCAQCGVYTVEVVYEPFMGDERISYQGPIPKEKGDAAVSLIKRCSEPWDKRCRCQAHMAYFGNALD